MEIPSFSLRSELGPDRKGYRSMGKSISDSEINLIGWRVSPINLIGWRGWDPSTQSNLFWIWLSPPPPNQISSRIWYAFSFFPMCPWRTCLNQIHGGTTLLMAKFETTPQKRSKNDQHWGIGSSDGTNKPPSVVVVVVVSLLIQLNPRA